MADVKDCRLFCLGDAILTGSTVPKLPFLLSLAKFPALEGVKLRVVFYDQDIYCAGPLFRLEGSKLDGFTAPGPDPLPDQADPAAGSPRSPQLAKGSGVLLILEGLLRKMPSFKKGWAFVVQDKKENQVANVGFVAVNSLDERSHDTDLGFMTWRADDLVALTQERRVLVRVVLAADGGGFREGVVFASNLCPAHTLTDGQGAPIPLRVRREPSPSQTQLGGSQSPPPPQLPPASDRVLSPNLTGYWEATFPGKAVPLTMFIHQAGHALVGWFQPVPSNIVQPNPPDLPPGFPNRPGTFRCQRDENNKYGPWPLRWGFSKDALKNDADPCDDFARENTPGSLELRTDQPKDDWVQQLQFTLTTDKGSVSFVVTRRSARSTRWPSELKGRILASNAQQPDAARAIQRFLDAQISPIPTSFWDHVSDVLSENNPDLVHAIESFVSFWASNVDRTFATVQIEIAFRNAVESLNEEQLAQSVPRIRYILSSNDVTINGDRKPLIVWLNVVVDGQTRTGKTLGRIFGQLGFSGEPRFVYTAEFQALPGVTIPRFGLGFGVAGFRVKLSKSVIDRNDPQKLTPTTDTDWIDSNAHWFIGAYLELGAGLGLSGLDWKAKDANGASLPGKVEFRASVDLHLKSFENASFSLAAIKGPTAQLSFFKAGGWSSTYISVRLADGSFLDAVVDKHMDFGVANFDLGTLKSFIEDPQKTIKRYQLPSKVETTLFMITQGGGVFGTTDNLPTRIDLPEDRQDPTKTGTPRCVEHAFFEHDSALLSDEKRSVLEHWLAVYRHLWTDADAVAAAEGFASPEGTKPYNQILSAARAGAVKIAVQDAFGPDLQVQNFSARGYGEGPAVAKDVGNLEDPESPSANRVLVRAQSQTDYPLWRRVDLWAAGTLIARVKGL